MKTNKWQVFSGYFYTAFYYAFNEDTKDWATPIEFRYKINYESFKAVGTSGKKVTMEQDMSGRPVIKRSIYLKTLADLPFKPKDKVYVVEDDYTYNLLEVVDQIGSFNAITNLQFKKRNDNRPKILKLGD
jgi:hypothetical protein